MFILLSSIIVALVVALLITLIQNRANSKSAEITADHSTTIPLPESVCCGAHEICEKETLLIHSAKIEYYEDEELDRYKGYTPDQYTETEIEEFREILYTLKDYEVTDWLKSIQLRKIQLPLIIREEAFMIIAEQRAGN